MRPTSPISYPYLPSGKLFYFVSLDNPWMQVAKQVTDQLTGCMWWPTGAAVVKDGELIGSGANQGTLQQTCARRDHNCPSGTGYEHCKSACNQQAHGEICAINNALANGRDPAGADLYVYGHWWCCKNCWDYMMRHGIKNVYLLENAHKIFTTDNRLELYEKNMERARQATKITHQHVKWVID